MYAKGNLSMSRPFVRQGTIVERLRNEIVTSRFPPGSRLPTRNELQRKFKASVMTVQRALEFLKDEGFVKACGRNGTFVSENPPHLWCYGMTFPHNPGIPGHWVRFWTALSHEAARIQHGSRRLFDMFYDMDVPSKSDHFARLEASIANQRLAGLIFPSRPFRFDNSPVLTAPGLPRVGIMDVPYNGVPAVALDHRAFIDKTLDYFVSRGRRRVAAVMVPGHGGWYMNYFRESAEKRGLQHRPWWMQVATQQAPEWTANIVQLLLQGTPDERPDCLLVTDDNLVEHAAAGVIQAGLRTPDDLDFIGHCNYPWPSASVLPLKRLGFDAGEILSRCVEVIDQQRRGDAVADRTMIPPRFEEELTPAMPANMGPSPTGFVQA